MDMANTGQIETNDVFGFGFGAKNTQRLLDAVYKGTPAASSGRTPTSR
jgi:hypothetical protein